MKKLFTFLLFTATAIICRAQMPNPALIGYWHNWSDVNAPYIQLDSIDSRYNVIEVSFAIATSPTDMNMIFVPDVVSKAVFKAKVLALQSQGKKVLLSIGGATTSIDLTTTINKNAFINSLTAIIDTYKFDGIDIDIEFGNSILITSGTIASPNNIAQINLIEAIKQIMSNYRTTYSKKLLLTMAPETAYVQGGQSGFGSIWGGYLPIIHALRDSLDILQVQLYNSGTMYGINGSVYTQGTADFIVAMTEAVIKGFNTAGGMFVGLPASKVAVGLPACSSAAGGGFIDTATVKAAINYVRGKSTKPGTYILATVGGYPTLRGMMTWSINWDAVSTCASKYQYALNYENIFGCASNPAPPAPTNTTSIANQSICHGKNTTLTATGTNKLGWYSASSGGTYLGGGGTFTTPMLTSNTTYYVQDSTCIPSATRTAILVTVKNLPTVTANATDTLVCAGKSVSLNGGGTATSFAWSGGKTNGVSFIPTLSTNSYTVTGTGANGCSDTAVITIQVKSLPTVTANASDTLVCAGKSVTLNGGGTATSFAWSGGKTNGLSFIPTLSTNSYTVTGTGANGCSDTAIITIQVKSLPTITANASDTLVCAGKSVTLNGGGTATSFAWSEGKTNGVSFIPTLSTNSYTVAGTGANGCSDTAKIIIQVKSLPTVTANASDTFVCAGKSVTLNGGGTATSFAWSGGKTNGVAFIPTLTTNSYTVTGTGANGCSDTAKVIIQVKSLPTVTANASDTLVCAGKSVTLNGGGTATSFAWSGGKTNGVSFIPTLATNSYTVTGTDANGCSDTAKIVIQVKPLPKKNTTLNGKTITAVETGATYQWINCFDKTLIVGENAQTFAAKKNGKYAVVISKNGCIDTSACVDIIMSGIYQNESIKQITIYPNPNYGAFTIKANTEGLFIIQNGLGQTIQIVRLDANNNYSVNFEHFNPGIYFIVGSINDQITKQTFVVTK